MKAVKFAEMMRNAGIALFNGPEPRVTVVATGEGHEAIQEFDIVTVKAAPGHITIEVRKI